MFPFKQNYWLLATSFGKIDSTQTKSNSLPGMMDDFCD